MFDKIESILAFAITALGFLGMAAGFVTSFLKNAKNKKLAAFAQKTNDIIELTKGKIIEVEKLFDQANRALKASGVKTGTIKKENVLNFIESQCVAKDIAFNKEYWSDQIESLIEIMNIKKVVV